LFYCIFDQINAALVSRRDCLQKHYNVINYSKIYSTNVWEL